MTAENFNGFSEDDKVIFFLILSEKVISVFANEEDQKIANITLDACWKWLEEKNIAADKLYGYLDNEENGITLLQERIDNDRDAEAWNCIIDAAAYTSRKAYEREGAKYFPEPIGLVDDNLAEHFIHCFKLCVKDAEKYILHVNRLLNANHFLGVPRRDFLRELI